MGIRITCINKAAGNHENRHVAISDLGWLNDVTNQTGKSTRLQMYDFVKQGGYAYVRDAYGDVAKLITAETGQGTKYVKTVADETKADNLLKLGECVW